MRDLGTHTATDTERSLAEAARFLALVGSFGAATVLARRYLDFHLGIPGHAGVGWMAVLVFGYLVTRRRGGGTALGISAALLSVPIGYGHGFGPNLLTFGLAGALLDAAYALPAVRAHSLVGGAVAGALAHMAKFGVVSGSVLLGGAVKNVALVGLGIGALNHLLFGLLGGALGAGIFLAGRRLVHRREARR